MTEHEARYIQAELERRLRDDRDGKGLPLELRCALNDLGVVLMEVAKHGAPAVIPAPKSRYVLRAA